MSVIVKTQKQLDAAIKAGKSNIVIDSAASARLTVRGNSRVIARENSRVDARGNSHVIARGNSHVIAWGNSRVVAWGNSRVIARGNSHVDARGDSHVDAWGNSRVDAWENSRVVAWGNSHVIARGNSYVDARENSHVVARENSRVDAWDNSRVIARGYVSLSVFSPHVTAKLSAKCHCYIHTKTSNISGGKRTFVRKETPSEWCDYYGIPVKNHVAVLYKAVDENFKSSYGNVYYVPGALPEATDWDGGKEECGGGLHFSPHPKMARSFFRGAKRFVACPVDLREMAVHPDGMYPEKIKAKRVCRPCWEVDDSGEAV